MSNKRLVKMIREGKIPNRGGVFFDVYTGYVSEEIAATITTRINDANNTYVTEICDTKEERYTPTKVSIGTTLLPSIEEN